MSFYTILIQNSYKRLLDLYKIRTQTYYSENSFMKISMYNYNKNIIIFQLYLKKFIDRETNCVKKV